MGPCPWQQRSAHKLHALQSSRGQDRGSSGSSSFLEFWPCCCSDSSLRPRPPPPRSRLPHILKTRSFPQEPVRCRTDGAGELPCCHVPGAQRAPGNAAPTCSLSPTPAPQHKGVPVLGVHSSPTAPQSWTRSSGAGIWYPQSHSPPWECRSSGPGREGAGPRHSPAGGRPGLPEAPRAGSPVTQ